MSERTDTLVGVVHALDNAGTLEVVNLYFLVLAALSVEDKLGNTWLVGTNLHTLVDIAVSMTGYGDRLLPVLHYRMD